MDIDKVNEATDHLTEPDLARTHHGVLLSTVAAYANIVAWGFAYGTYNHEFELPLVNWLHDPSLYPNDPITEAFARFPTIFWPVVTYLSHWMSTERVIFLFFLLTKLLFFTAVVRLVESRVRDEALAACIVLAVALSPFLNDLTPLGASNILEATQTHTSLTVALLVWVGCFLLEGRWIPAALLCGFTIYLDALFYVFILFAFATFAILDWRSRRPAILLAGLLGAAISVPWLVLSRGTIFLRYPKGYVEALLAFYPYHLNLRSHEKYELLSAAGLMLAGGLIVVVARRTRMRPDLRLELLTASFLIPILLGSLFGKFFLTPTLARLQLLRADSFLVLYMTLLIQIYGANLPFAAARIPATTFLLSELAILMPLADSLGLVWPLLICGFLWASRPEPFENVCRTISGSRRARFIILSVLLAWIVFAGIAKADWTSTVVILLLIIGGSLFIYQGPEALSIIPAIKLMITVSSVAIVMIAAGTVPTVGSFWHPTVAQTPLEQDWRAVQEWAKANTPREAQFLVPTYPGGFREFSERSSWGEWKDGQAMYLYPPFEAEYRKRMMAVGYSWGKWNGTKAITETYKHLSWEQLSEVARQNHLSYIIQFRDVAYPVTPIIANQGYAVYKVAY